MNLQLYLVQIVRTESWPCLLCLQHIFFIFTNFINFFRNRVILEAEAESEAVRVKGEAEAFAIEARAKAEAEQMAKKADAWKDYQDAAMIDMILETLPKVRHTLICYIYSQEYKT